MIVRFELITIYSGLLRLAYYGIDNGIMIIGIHSKYKFIFFANLGKKKV